MVKLAIKRIALSFALLSLPCNLFLVHVISSIIIYKYVKARFWDWSLIKICHQHIWLWKHLHFIKNKINKKFISSHVPCFHMVLVLTIWISYCKSYLQLCNLCCCNYFTLFHRTKCAFKVRCVSMSFFSFLSTLWCSHSSNEWCSYSVMIVNFVYSDLSIWCQVTQASQMYSSSQHDLDQIKPPYLTSYSSSFSWDPIHTFPVKKTSLALMHLIHVWWQGSQKSTSSILLFIPIMTLFV